jgi:hypothetical protein
LAGFGFFLDTPTSANVNYVPTSHSTGDDLSLSDDDATYSPIATFTSPDSQRNTIFVNADFLRFIPRESATRHENGVFTPPSSPVLGPQFAEDGGHQEYLQSLMFGEAASCILPEELLSDYRSTIPFWAESVYVEDDLVASPFKVEE